MSKIHKVAGFEFGIASEDHTNFKPTGVLDHFYENSVIDEKESAYNVCLTYRCRLIKRLKSTMDQMHSYSPCFDVAKIAGNKFFIKRCEFMHLG